MNTPYCSKNQAFSDAAHAAAELSVYPAIFPDCIISFACQSVADGGEGRVNDGEKAIDYILEVESKKFYPKKRHTFTVQERWRKKGYMGFNDLTITASNPTGQRSEWEKMQCQWMLYGFYCQEKNEVLQACWANVSAIRFKAVIGESGYQFAIPSHNSRSFQRFYSVPRSLPEVLPITPLAEPLERTS